MSPEAIQAKAVRLAEEHWSWLESILFQQRLMEKKLFTDAFTHGYRHGYKDGKEKK